MDFQQKEKKEGCKVWKEKKEIKRKKVQRGKVNKNEGLVVETEIGSSERLHNLSLLSFGKEGNYTSFTYFSL